jgi:dihydrolipoamide dehydrogenase
LENFLFLANGKSITIGDTEGIVKTIFNKETGELIGAHLIGSDVTELINSLSVAKSLETTEIELMKTVFAHPTLSETLHESVLSAYDKAIHI